MDVKPAHAFLCRLYIEHLDLFSEELHAENSSIMFCSKVGAGRFQQFLEYRGMDRIGTSSKANEVAHLS